MYVVKQQVNEVIYYIIVKYIKKLKKNNTNKHNLFSKCINAKTPEVL